MSSLWTPGGEHPVDRSSEVGPGPEPEGGEPTPEELAAAYEALSPEEKAQVQALQAEMAEARARLAETPAAIVVANHAMGLYELGAIHLSSAPPNLAEASVAIDALGALVDGLGDRLGEAAPTLRSALDQIRVAYVQVRGATSAPGD
ncbi:MAG: hypothetical protein AB7L84_04050 [Acidimicrobiia bacterium]